MPLINYVAVIGIAMAIVFHAGDVPLAVEI